MTVRVTRYKEGVVYEEVEYTIDQLLNKSKPILEEIPIEVAPTEEIIPAVIEEVEVEVKSEIKEDISLQKEDKPVKKATRKSKRK
jgi:hypothetical protein